MKNGYGRIQYKNHPTLAHRFMYEQMVGPIPEGMTLDHLCRNRLCINPAHLDPVVMRTNILRGVGPTAVNAKRTHCKHGHEFTVANTYRTVDGHRVCRECARLKQEEIRRTDPERVRLKHQRYRERNREAINARIKAWKKARREQRGQITG